HLGLGAMNVDSDGAFVARAVALGRDAHARRALRAELTERRRVSGLFDMDGFARDCAAAVAAMAVSPARSP
ncbi:hypothetical protein ABTE92_18795, partial [Acinetobacter baumannii]